MMVIGLGLGIGLLTRLDKGPEKETYSLLSALAEPAEFKKG